MRLIPERDEGVNFWPVYSDLAMVMVLLLLLFILTQFVVNSQLLTNEAISLARFNIQREEAEKQLAATLAEAERHRQLAERYAADLAALAAQLAKTDGQRKAVEESLARKSRARVEVERRQADIKKIFENEPGIRDIRPDGSLHIFTFKADMLFPTDQATLSPRGDALLRHFGRALLEHATFYTRIEIEGHADENKSRNFVRPGDVQDDHGNWRLSAERAITVAQLLQGLGIPSKQLAVVGRSFYEPENPEHSEKAWEQNRRVQVRLFYSEITQ